MRFIEDRAHTYMLVLILLLYYYGIGIESVSCSINKKNVVVCRFNNLPIPLYHNFVLHAST